MIPKLDTYMYKTLKRYIRAILTTAGTEDEPYVLGTVLAGFEPGVADNFKKAFTGESKKKLPIDVVTSYPTTKQQVNALYVISRGSAEEDTSAGSIGLDTGNSESQGRSAIGGTEVNKAVQVSLDSRGYYLDIGEPILAISSISGITDNLIDMDSFNAGDTKIRLISPMPPEQATALSGASLHVIYTPKDVGSRSDYAGYIKGYQLEESLIITECSNNIDTLRCLDSLLKYILIMTKSSVNEGTDFQLAHIHSDPLGISDVREDRNIYQIQTVVTYKDTYQVPEDAADRLNKILLNGQSVTD